MKKLLTVITAVAGFSAASFGQGTILFGTTAAATTKVSVNSSVGGTTFALTPASSTYYFALFASTTSSSVLGSSAAIIGGTGPNLSSGASYVFNDNNWTFVSYGQSTGVAGKFAASGTVNSDGTTTIPIATAASIINVVAVGWSSNIGATYQSVEAFFSGAGPSSGFVGESAVASIPAGSVPGSGNAPYESLFGSQTGQVGGLKLGDTAVPEPTSIALGVMGGLSLLALRRKKA
jgi:hypothetical protein